MTTKTSKIGIVQTNLQHSVTGSATLRRTLEEQPYTIALVQEPYLHRGQVKDFIGLKGNVFMPSASQGKTRTLIYVPNSFKASLVTHFCTGDLTVVKLETGLPGKFSSIFLVSAYMDGSLEAPPPGLENIMHLCARDNIECVIGCDANAHCTIWGSPDTNDRGKDVLDFVLRHNLNILNRGSEPTFVPSWTKTIVDITLATNDIADTIGDWHVATHEYSGSDHRRIRFSLEVREHKPRTYRNPKKTDKSLFLEILNDALIDVPDIKSEENITTDNIEEMVEYVAGALMKSYKGACPLKTENNKILLKRDRWWNKGLSKLRKKARHKFNRAINTNKEEDWQEYRKQRHQLKVEILKSKKTSWKKFSNSIQSESETARLRKLVSNNTQTKLGTLRKSDGSYTTSEQEQFDLLLQTHFPECRLGNEDGWECHTSYKPGKEDWEFAASIVTDEALLWAISTFQPFKSAGMDGILPALLQWSISKIKTYLATIFRACLAYKYIPNAWREVKVIFLPKPGKSDYTDPKAFRPISLSSFLLKTLERLCDRYIRSGPLREKPVHRNQHAYQAGKSTETALHQVVHKIESALENKQSCLVTFIDIEGAFDKTTFHSIERGLRRHDVDERVNKWVTTMLANRVASTESSQESRCVVTKGCPQGGVISPLLWVIVANELIELLNKEGITTVGYADDLAIMVSGISESTLCEKMQQALRIVEEWCKRQSLSVNPQKTEMVLFTRKTKIPNLKLPTLFGTKLTLSKEVKYLGIWLDSKLLWGKQLDHVTTKATNILWQCTRAIGKDWGLKPKLCRWLYTVIVRPVLTYGCIVWWPRTILATTINKLQKTQRLACSLISGCAKSTPSAALNIILGLTPLHLHIQQEAMASALRIKSTNQWKGTGSNTNHCRILDRATKIVPEACKGTDRVASTYLDNKCYELVTEEYASADVVRAESKCVFTDGAKNDKGAGCGFYSPELEIRDSKALNKTTTVLQAEAMGLLLAARAVLSRDAEHGATGNRELLTFITDSAAIIYALRKPTTRSRVVAECHSVLQHLTNIYKVTVQWTKSHSSCKGNNEADLLAKEGTKKEICTDVAELCKPTVAETRNLLRLHTEKEQQNLWNKTIDCKHAKKIFPSINRKLTNKLLGLSRSDLRQMIGIITGHCDLNYHLHKIGATDSPLCRGCLLDNETVEHVLLHCTATEQARSRSGLLEKSQRQNQLFNETPDAIEVEQLCQRPKAVLRYFKELGWFE